MTGIPFLFIARYRKEVTGEMDEVVAAAGRTLVISTQTEQRKIEVLNGILNREN